MSQQECFVKMFKYFDTQDKGFVTYDEFCKVLEKTGMFYDHKNLKQLFFSYDRDGNGQVDYQELSFMLFNENTRPDARPNHLVSNQEK